MPCCFWGSSIKFLGHTAKKIVNFDPNWAFPDCNSSLNSPMGTKWCTKLEVIAEVPYCVSTSSVKFQSHTVQKIVEFDPDWAFPDCNSSLNSPMATKCCTKLEVALKQVPYCFARSSVKFQGRTALKIVEFEPDWAFPDWNDAQSLQ